MPSQHSANPESFRPPAEIRQWLNEAAEREGRSKGDIISASLERTRLISDAGIALLERDQTRAAGEYYRNPCAETAAALDQATDRFAAGMRQWARLWKDDRFEGWPVSQPAQDEPRSTT